MCLCAFLALFTVISCDKSEPVQSEGITERKPVPEPTEKIPLEFDDKNEVQIEGILVRQGDVIPFSVLKEKAPEFYEQNIGRRINHSRAFILDTMPSWSVNWTWSQNCNCGPEYCPKLGAEVQGQKNGSWIQVDNRASYEWWKQMAYYDDEKNLTNFSNGNHQFRHINYNAKGTLVVTLFYQDPNTQTGVFIDIDGPLTVGDYGSYTWCSAYHESRVINSAPDEGGISDGGIACKPYTTVSSYRNSFGLISYTACYVLGGLSALNLF